MKLSKTQQETYSELVRARVYVDSFKGGTDALRLITMLKQLCIHPSLITAAEDKSEDSVVPSNKLLLLGNLLQTLDSSPEDERIVVISNFTKALDVVKELCDTKGYVYLRLDGSTNAQDRQRLVDRFNDKTSYVRGVSPFVFLLSSKAGGCGLNLIGANRLVLLDPDWNPAVDQQACARIWREGQARDVYIFRLMSTGTIEERIYQRQLMKLSSANTASGGADLEMKKFSLAELRDLFKLNLETTCDTFDLIHSGDPQGIDSKGWSNSDNHETILDESMRHVVQGLGSGVVSFVHQEPFSKSPTELATRTLNSKPTITAEDYALSSDEEFSFA